MAGVLVKMIVCGIPVRVTAIVTRHVKLMIIQISKKIKIEEK